MTVVASRPAMEKSTFVQNILSNVAIKDNGAVLFYSLEDSKETIVNRLTISNSMVEDTSIYIESDAPYTIEDICIKSRELKLKKDIELIIIDDIQLIQVDKKELLSRDNEITEILKRLKILAKELDVHIIVTSIIVAKNNDGGINTIKLAGLPEYCMFGDVTALKEKENY